jgi:hypothetical protein
MPDVLTLKPKPKDVPASEIASAPGYAGIQADIPPFHL